jgi:hypothetical protein
MDNWNSAWINWLHNGNSGSSSKITDMKYSLFFIARFRHPESVYLGNPQGTNTIVADLSISAFTVGDIPPGFLDAQDVVENGILRDPAGSQMIDRCHFNIGIWPATRIIYSHDSSIFSDTAFVVNNSKVYMLQSLGVDTDTYERTLPYLKLVLDSFTP